MRTKGILLVLMAGTPGFGANSSLLGISAGKDGSSLSVPMQIVILLTLMTLLPAAVMSITPFLRIVVVLHFLRQALGTQSTPSNQVLIGLALFLAIVIMQPVPPPFSACFRKSDSLSEPRFWKGSTATVTEFAETDVVDERLPCQR